MLVACLKIKLPCDKTAGYLRTIHFFQGSSATLIRCISSAFHKVHIFRCGGLVHNHLYEISLEFCVPKFIQIGSFLTELFKKYNVDVCLRHCAVQ